MKLASNTCSTLNKVLTNELTGINQHFLHARMMKNWGFESLNKKAYKRSIEEMKDADDLIERILLLEGLPNLQQLGKLLIGETPEECLECDMTFEQQKIDQLRKAIADCEQAQDYISRELLEKLLEHGEEYLDWLETQQYLIANTGTQNYLQSQI
ncbi:MAG: bacterioferritin [Motiliproteus sp.]|nr:bacterioferritin [Motiliproteus sp.]MCW9052879.1 bacterioferritin [Motiliproteus sp.]